MTLRQLVALIPLLAAGCGFTGEDPFAGRRLADVASWQDGTPLTFCDGLQRVGPLALGAAGLCRPSPSTPEEEAPPPCTEDAGCRSRERCVCGACTVALCDAATECGPERVCSFDDRRCDRPCTGDAQCAAGERCLLGKHVCRGTCAADEDCQSGESCRRATGDCVVSACSADGDCSGGRACALQRVAASLAHPAPVLERNGITLWLERTDAAPGSVAGIWRARSADGQQFRFDPARALFAGRVPSVAPWPDHGYLMLYGGAGGLGRAHSGDGAQWVLDGAPVVRGADEPSLIRWGDRFIAYYTEDDAAPSARRIARALSGDGVTFTPAGPVLTPAQVSVPVLWRDVDTLAAPFAELRVSEDGRDFVRLWFAARGVETAPSLQFGRLVPTPPDYSIGEAASEDGFTFVPHPFNPVFDRVLDFLTHPSELDPAVIAWRGEDLLFYRRAAADGTQSENLAFARSPARPR